MPKPSPRTFAVALTISVTLASAVPATAAPVAAAGAPVAAVAGTAEPAVLAPTVRARLIAPHLALTRLRTAARPLVVHYTAAPLPFTLHPAPGAPMKALPLVAPPTTVTVVPPFLPRLAFAALPDLAVWDHCATRSAVILSVLPTAPYTSMACERDLNLAAAGPDLPPSLIPGHNKNALYGNAHAPRSGDDDP